MCKIIALSDTHGYLPDIPECDILLLGGDYSPGPKDRDFLQGPFTEWLRKLPARHIIGIAGNHDWEFQRSPEAYRGLPWHYLEDSGIELMGLSFWGSPWTPPFCNWAFMAEEHKLRYLFSKIPAKLDVLITHGPPHNILDRNINGRPCGSVALYDRVQRVAPRLHVFGHIHEASGKQMFGKTTCANVSYVNFRYAPVHAPVEFNLS